MGEIQRQPVSSSDIASIGYDAATETLEIEFSRTPSPGKFFRQHVKTKYAWEKVSGH